MTGISHILLNNGISMPMLGLGTYKLTGAPTTSALSYALQNGYRLIDTASAYKNEEEIGKVLSSCSIPRDQLFITTKLWNTAQRVGNIEDAFFRSLERLRLDYIDLYLIHWPVPGCYLDSWHVLEKLYHSGYARAIGVSNFEIEHLEKLSQISSIVPAVNQIEYHPLWNRSDLYQYCQEKGIVLQAYAPLARGAYLQKDILLQIGKKYNKTPTQIGLRWLIQKGVCPIPKSVQSTHILSNKDIFDFSLNDFEIKAIDALDEKFQSSGIPEDLR